MRYLLFEREQVNKTYLIHHGIKGQKWGDRQAAWYPIDEYKKAQKNNKKAERYRSNSMKLNLKSQAIVEKSAKKGIERYTNKAAKASDERKKNKYTRIANDYKKEATYKTNALKKEYDVLSKMTVDDLLADRSVVMKSGAKEVAMRKLFGATTMAIAEYNQYVKPLKKTGKYQVYNSVARDQQLHSRIGEKDAIKMY